MISRTVKTADHEAGGNPAGWLLEDYQSWTDSLGEPRYRAAQAANWIFRRGIADPYAMTDLPAKLKSSLKECYRPRLPEVIKQRLSSDGTTKFLLALDDGLRIEMVLIPEAGRTTLCFSSQVGCPIGCLFCATGQGGFQRNLSAAEITGQVILARTMAANLTNIVVMGMGEPLLNYDHLIRAMTIIISPWGLSIAPKRITVSTAGVTPRLAQFRGCFPSVNLAVSLNAPDDALRNALMPGTSAWPLRGLLAAIERLPGKSRHNVTFEYVLIGGVNDALLQAEKLARRIGNLRARVNLIAYNMSPSSGFKPSPPENMARFQSILRDHGIQVTRRKSRGGDIEAACGQLLGRVPESRSKYQGTTPT